MLIQNAGNESIREKLFHTWNFKVNKFTYDTYDLNI